MTIQANYCEEYNLMKINHWNIFLRPEHTKKVISEEKLKVCKFVGLYTDDNQLESSLTRPFIIRVYHVLLEQGCPRGEDVSLSGFLSFVCEVTIT